MSGLWLMACTVLLAAFSGKLRDQQLKPKPIYWIETWDDLYEWKDIQIQTYDLTEVSNFVKNFPNDTMAQDFGMRANIREQTLLTNDLVGGGNIYTFFDFDGMRTGRTAIIYANHFLQILKKKLISDEFREDIDFHLSEGTVRNYLSEAINKLGAANRIEAARVARSKGWL